jgi:hypothetical protein
MSKGRKVPPRPLTPLYVVGPWVRSIGGDLEQNFDRLITTGWRYWAAIAYRGYAAEGPGAVAIKLDRADPPLPDDALIFNAVWTPISDVPEVDDEVSQNTREAAKTIDPLFGIVFVAGYTPDKQAFVTQRVADILHEQFAEQLERNGLVDRVGVVGAFDLISDFTSPDVTPSA